METTSRTHEDRAQAEGGALTCLLCWRGPPLHWPERYVWPQGAWGQDWDLRTAPPLPYHLFPCHHRPPRTSLSHAGGSWGLEQEEEGQSTHDHKCTEGLGVGSREHDCGSDYQCIPKCLRPSVCNWAWFFFFLIIFLKNSSCKN